MAAKQSSDPGRYRPMLFVAATVLLAAVLAYGLLMGGSGPPAAQLPLPETAGGVAQTTGDAEPPESRYAELRERMVEVQIAARGVSDERVLDAMRRVPRHLFVPRSSREQAYADWPVSIGHRQTISQPYMVAIMTELARPAPGAKALDVGTGSGYQAAVLAGLVDKVYSIEILEPLADEARERLSSLGYENIEVRHGDGYRGWPEQAPFDLIIVAAAPDHVPQPLIDQLVPGGRLVIPVGERGSQNLIVIEKQADGSVRREEVFPVGFVPMTGEAEGGGRGTRAEGREP